MKTKKQGWQGTVCLRIEELGICQGAAGCSSLGVLCLQGKYQAVAIPFTGFTGFTTPPSPSRWLSAASIQPSAEAITSKSVYVDSCFGRLQIRNLPLQFSSKHTSRWHIGNETNTWGCGMPKSGFHQQKSVARNPILQLPTIYDRGLPSPPPMVPPPCGLWWWYGSSGPPPVVCGGGMLVCWYVGMLVCWYVCMYLCMYVCWYVGMYVCR